MPSSASRPAPNSETPSKTTIVFTIFNGLILQHCPEHNTMHTARVVARRGRVRDIKVDGREAPIRAATGCPLGRGAHACHGVSQRSLTVAALSGGFAPRETHPLAVLVHSIPIVAAPLVQLPWNKDLPMLRTRRRLLQALTMLPAFHALPAVRKEFWENKDPAEWSDEEKRTLLGQSPWAREGFVRFEVEKKGAQAAPYEGGAGPGGNIPGAHPRARPGAPGNLPIGEPPPPVPSPGNGQAVQVRVLARWESAKPVRL